MTGFGTTMPLDRSPGFGVYIHWPFCAAKCPYCDFNSHVRHQPVGPGAFCARLRDRNWRLCAPAPGRARVTSIFLGGGTPSLMQPQTVAAVLDAVAKKLDGAGRHRGDAGSHPSSVEAERFRGYRAAGVNRVSLGVQALNDKDLRFSAGCTMR